MENFNEFDNRTTSPQKDSSSVLAHAFDLYKKGIGYALLSIVATIIGSYILSFIAQIVTGFNPLEASALMRSGDTDFTNVFAIPGYSSFLGLSGILGLLLYPINAGFLYILNKINFNERVEIADLFIGYRQNTLQLILYGFLFTVILVVSFSLCFLPGLFIAPLFMLGLPIVFFENASAVDGLKKSFEIVKSNYWALWVIAVLSFLISMSGLIVCIVGVIATAPFIYAGIYSAYCAYNGAPKPILKK